ncbi:MAG: TetR/AcrR family transcriptional regulator [Chloroflexota bacterium]|jgi:AcrR family transcriptional regulator
MPRPRFNKLSANKQERILEAAAKEFAAHGFDGASLNQILDEAAISKGAAYYYFDDKADLYATTVLHYSQELMADLSFDLAQFTVANFWDELAAIYRQQFTSFAERPWVFGVAKAGGAPTMEMLMAGPLVELWQQAQVLLAQLIQRGRELGVIREDMPEELLLALLIAVDDAHDRWLYAHRAELSSTDLEQAADRISDTLRRLLAPG